MNRTYIKDIVAGTPCRVRGFIENIRNKRTMAFLVIRDVTGKLQLTIEKEKSPELAAVVDKLMLESVVTVTGTVVENEYVKLGGREMLPETMEIDSLSEAIPIGPDANIDTRLDYRWIDLRTEKNLLMFRVQTAFVAAMRKFLVERDFIEIHTPKLIGAASESGADVFELKYFDRKAYLAQSPQFYKQMAMASGFDRIFETGPVFRAEKSFTNKHTTEFTGFDLEFSYIDSHEDVMAMEEDMLTAALAEVKEKYGEAIEATFGIPVVVPEKPFPRMKLADVYAALKERYGYECPEGEEGDLTTEAERLCADLARDMFGHEFLFVTDYSAEKRAFYHMRDENGVPKGYDLIWRGGRSRSSPWGIRGCRGRN